MNAHDILFYGNRTLLAGLERIPATERNTPGVVGWWSTRETLAHLAVFEEGLVEVLETFLAGGGTPMIADMDSAKNDEMVARKKDLTVDQVLAEYNAAHAQAMDLIAKITPERSREVGAIPWYGAEYSLDDFLVYTFYGHKREHTARFEAFGDQLDDQNKKG